MILLLECSFLVVVPCMFTYLALIPKKIGEKNVVVLLCHTRWQ